MAGFARGARRALAPRHATSRARDPDFVFLAREKSCAWRNGNPSRTCLLEVEGLRALRVPQPTLGKNVAERRTLRARRNRLRGLPSAGSFVPAPPCARACRGDGGEFVPCASSPERVRLWRGVGEARGRKGHARRDTGVEQRQHLVRLRGRQRASHSTALRKSAPFCSAGACHESKPGVLRPWLSVPSLMMAESPTATTRPRPGSETTTYGLPLS